MKERLKNFWFVTLLTTVLLYVVIGFVTWEFDWIKHLADTSTTNRLWFFGAFALKVTLDLLLWKRIKAHSDEVPVVKKEQERLGKEMNKKPHNL